MKAGRFARASMALPLLAVAAGCSTTQTFVDYSSSALYSTETVGNVPYVEVGPASASQRGFFWENCETLAAGAVTKLKQEGEHRGATAVSSVRWLNQADGTYTEKPICTTGWGWLLAPPVLGAFFPWVKMTEVQGRLVGADETSLARLRGDVAKRSAAWQAEEAKRLAAAALTDEDRAAAQAAADKAAADKAAADKAAAEKAAADKAAAEKAAAEKAALDRELEAKLAAEKAAAEKAEVDKAAKAAKLAKKKKKAAATP